MAGIFVALLSLADLAGGRVFAGEFATLPVLCQNIVPATAFAMTGDQVSFTSIFSNLPAAHLQWQKISQGMTSNITGATNSTLTLTNLQLADTAIYRLKAINSIEGQTAKYTSGRPLIVAPLPEPVDNVITVIAAQTGQGRDTTFTPTWEVSTNNDLIAGRMPSRYRGNFSLEKSGRSVASLTAGGAGALKIITCDVGTTAATNYVTCGNQYDAGSSLTYRLTGATNGYDLTNIVVYGGWADGNRDQQAYTVYYSTVTAPAQFIRLAAVNYNPSDRANAQSATRVSLRPASGVLASNVAAVAFDFTGLPSKNGFCGYSQIILRGQPSATPPAPVSSAVDDTRYPMSELDFLGSWIWASRTFDKQTCQFSRTFDIPPGKRVRSAALVLTADNEYLLYFDGRLIGRADDWREYWVYDTTLLMTPGQHVLAVQAYNSSAAAGLILGLHVDFDDEEEMEVKSDPSWKVVPAGTSHWETRTSSPDWPAATAVAEFGQSPWNNPPSIRKAGPPLQPVQFSFWQSPWFQIPAALAASLVLLATFFLAAQLAIHEKERRLLQRERARIAMDIHDDIGSRITQLLLNGEDAQAALPPDSRVRRQLVEVWNDARTVLSSIDEILWALNPRLDTLRDFADYICDYAHKFLEPSGIACVFEVDSPMQLTTADLPLRRSLLMAIKETLNNTVKHARATELRLKIERRRQNLVIVVQDNGRGFDCGTVKPGRNGLVNISRRIRELGGNCQIISQPGQGCRIEFDIPLTRPRRFNFFWSRK